MSDPMPEHGGIPHLPDPTPWPLVLALGLTLVPVGLVAGPRLALGPLPLPVLTVVGLVFLALGLYKLIMEDVHKFRAEQGG